MERTAPPNRTDVILTHMPSAPHRVALITGGAKRVGRAIAQRLADDGFDILFTYQHSADEANAFVKTLSDQGRRAVAIALDLGDPELAARTLLEGWSRHFSRLDVLVNSASVYEPGALGTITVAQMRRLWAVNVESPLLLCQAFSGALRASNGHVVNMLDILAQKPWPQYMAYCASKSALSNITLSLARELAPQVTVNGIAPGVVDWPKSFPQVDRDRYLQRVPLSRAGTPGDVAEAVHFLCTTGSYITGQIIALDGGRSLT